MLKEILHVQKCTKEKKADRATERLMISENDEEISECAF